MKYVEGKAFLDNFGLGMEEDLLRRLKRGIEEFINLCFEQMPPELKLSYVEEYLNDVNNFSRGVGPRTKNPLNLRLYINTFNDGHTNGIMYDVSLSELIKQGIKDAEKHRIVELRDALSKEVEKLNKVINK